MVKKNDKSKLKKLQLEELNILKEFIRVCEKHNLRFYSLGGTLLGSIRHKGFIPWDDDIDVAMPRKDYEKFLRLNSDEFNDEFEVITYENDKNYRYPWARLIIKKMAIINKSANIPRKEYVWIDIIPLDGYPDSKILRFFHKLRLSFWWNLNQIIQYDELVDQKRPRGMINSILVKVASLFKFLGKFVNYKKCLFKLNVILSKYPYDIQSKKIINFLAAYGFDEIFDRNAFNNYAEYKFENINLRGPKDYDSVLKTIYGDYMQLPPKEQRNKHNAEILIESEVTKND